MAKATTKQRAGKLRHYVNVRNTNYNTDEFGQAEPSHATDLGDHWCSIEPIGGQEPQTDGRMIAWQSYKFTFRYDSVLAIMNPEAHIVFDSRTFEVESSWQELEENHWIIAIAKETKV